MERKFKNEYIYFALESIRSCFVNIKVEFFQNRPKNPNNNNLNTNENQHEEQDLEDFSPMRYSGILKEPDEIVPQTDKIDKYVQQMSNWK